MTSSYDNSDDSIESFTNDTKFVVFMGMKILRLFHAQTIADTLKRFMEILGNIFFLHSYMFENLYKWVIAALKFIVSIHYFACVWILIHE